MGLQVSSIGPGGKLIMSNGQQLSPNGGPVSPYAPPATVAAPTGMAGLPAGMTNYGSPLGFTPGAQPAGSQGLGGVSTPNPGSPAGLNTAADYQAITNYHTPPSTTEAPTQTPATPAVPPPVDYYAQYEASLAGARANLTNQYVQAQHSIDQQQGDANASLIQLPGQYKTINNQENGELNRETGVLNRADTAAGMGGAGPNPAQRTAQSEDASRAAQNNAANKAGIPGMALGVKTQMDAERASLNDSYTTAQGTLDSAAMGVEASRAAQAEDYAHQTAAEKLSHTQAVNDATTAFKRQVVLQALGSGADLNASSTKVPGMTVGDEKSITASPYFSMIQNEINTGKDPNGKTVTSADIEKTLGQMDVGNGGVQGNIPGYSGSAGAGLLTVLKAYYGPTLGLSK